MFTTHLAPNPEAVVNLLNVDNAKWQLMSVENSCALQQAGELCAFMAGHVARLLQQQKPYEQRPDAQPGEMHLGGMKLSGFMLGSDCAAGEGGACVRERCVFGRGSSRRTALSALSAAPPSPHFFGFVLSAFDDSAAVVHSAVCLGSS